uniref:Putative secreted protein n=1 Tax=Ixodes ricinus TaxID=34613 RepID=A0A147BAE4_IXORI
MSFRALFFFLTQLVSVPYQQRGTITAADKFYQRQPPHRPTPGRQVTKHSHLLLIRKASPLAKRACQRHRRHRRYRLRGI